MMNMGDNEGGWMMIKCVYVWMTAVAVMTMKMGDNKGGGWVDVVMVVARWFLTHGCTHMRARSTNMSTT
jgi:hypothetical protein